MRVGTEALSVTASVGVTEHRIGETYSQTVNRADAALLDAKRSDRDKCVFAALPPLPAPSARLQRAEPPQASSRCGRTWPRLRSTSSA